MMVVICWLPLCGLLLNQCPPTEFLRSSIDGVGWCFCEGRGGGLGVIDYYHWSSKIFCGHIPRAAPVSYCISSNTLPSTPYRNTTECSNRKCKSKGGRWIFCVSPRTFILINNFLPKLPKAGFEPLTFRQEG